MIKNAIIVILLVLLIPTAAIAQDDIIDLIFTDGGTSIEISKTITSVANVKMELDGIQYQVQVPVTIDIDTLAPLSSSQVAADSASVVGQYAITFGEYTEATDEVEIVIPGLFFGREKEVEPSAEGRKVVIIRFDATNLGEEEDGLGSYGVQGVDETGRLFDEIEFDCERVNPGETGKCIIIFDVEEEINIVGLNVETTHSRTLPISAPIPTE